MTKQELLEETLEAYKDPSQRSFDSGGCQYLDDKGRMCAVGRCMIDPNIKTRSVGKIDDLDSKLKDRYRGLPLDFWNHLQVLHDHWLHWDKNGLTYFGLKFLDGICNGFELKVPEGYEYDN